MDWTDFIVPLIFVLAWFGFLYLVDSQEDIEKEIIRNSDDYVIYKDCTKISNKYYCKGYVEGEINEYKM